LLSGWGLRTSGNVTPRIAQELVEDYPARILCHIVCYAPFFM
jgi:hypothetical protein